MIVKFDEYINEKVDLIDLGVNLDRFTDRLINKFKSIVDYPVIKHIERKTKDLSDEEKLLKISEISNKIDKIFSPMNNLKFMILTSFSFLGYNFINNTIINWNDLYIYFIINVLYTTLSKKYRLLAKENFKKIKNLYIKKYLSNKNIIDIDPLCEEEWEEDDNIIKKSNDIRYNKKYKHTEHIPYIGLGIKKDIHP